jgi:choline dehydrogenase-like flavoprotein
MGVVNGGCRCRPQEGYGTFQVAITARGRRADAYRQFLTPVLGRKNLEVVIRTQVSKIEFETRGGTPTAVGVQMQGVLVCGCFSAVVAVPQLLPCV